MFGQSVTMTADQQAAAADHRKLIGVAGLMIFVLGLDWRFTMMACYCYYRMTGYPPLPATAPPVPAVPALASPALPVPRRHPAPVLRRTCARARGGGGGGGAIGSSGNGAEPPPKLPPPPEPEPVASAADAATAKLKREYKEAKQASEKDPGNEKLKAEYRAAKRAYKQETSKGS